MEGEERWRRKEGDKKENKTKKQQKGIQLYLLTLSSPLLSVLKVLTHLILITQEGSFIFYVELLLKTNAGLGEMPHCVDCLLGNMRI